jgi:hypothetical protein
MVFEVATHSDGDQVIELKLRSVAAMVLMALAAACESDRVTAEPTGFPVSFTVSNNLIAPVTLAVDAIPIVGLSGGGSTGLTVLSTSQWLTWKSAKPMDARGQPIQDDIGEVQISVGGINRVLEITNVIADQTYFTARIFNNTHARVSIGVYDGSSVSCAAELPAASGSLKGFTLIGYYKLQPATEIRVFRDHSACVGPYVTWPNSRLKDFSPKSGVVTLLLDSPP